MNLLVPAEGLELIILVLLLNFHVYMIEPKDYKKITLSRKYETNMYLISALQSTDFFT